MYEPKLRGLGVQFYTHKYREILTQILQELEELSCSHSFFEGESLLAEDPSLLSA